MALKQRYLISAGGPDTKSAWSDFQYSRLDQNDYNNTNGWPFYLAPLVSAYGSNGLSADFISSGAPIKTALAFYIMFDKNVAINVATTISVNVLRAGVAIGGTTVAGWASGAAPAFTAMIPVQIPFTIANTALVVVPGSTAVTTTKALLKLQPLDVITMTMSSPTAPSANIFIASDIS